MWRSTSSVTSRSRRLASGTRGSGGAPLSLTAGSWPPATGADGSGRPERDGARRSADSSARLVDARLGGDLLGVEAVDLVDQLVGHEILRGHRLLDGARLQHE